MNLYQKALDLDQWVIERFEALSARLTRNSSTSCYWWSAQCFGLTMLGDILITIDKRDWTFFLGVMLDVLYIGAALRAHANARAKLRALATSLMELNRIVRFLMVFVFVVFWLTFLLRVGLGYAHFEWSNIPRLLSTLMFPAGLYFMACRPEPPQYDREKIRGVHIKL